jgi:hypothetical protein
MFEGCFFSFIVSTNVFSHDSSPELIVAKIAIAVVAIAWNFK